MFIMGVINIFLYLIIWELICDVIRPAKKGIGGDQMLRSLAIFRARANFVNNMLF